LLKVSGIVGIKEAVKRHSIRLETLAIITAERQATDPRDKIYALLSLCADRYGINPEYSFTVSKCYSTSFKAMLQNGRDISILGLSLGDSANRDSTLPTWVPDLQALSRSRKMAPISQGTSEGRGFYEAAPRSIHASMSFEEDDTILIIRGIVSDSIDNIGDPIPSVPEDRARGVSSSLKPTISQARGMIARWSRTYVTGDTLESAFWRTITMDRQVIGYHPARSTEAHSEKRLDRPDMRVPPATPQQESLLIKALEYQVGRIGTITHRRFFTTTKGYIGICPPAAQKDDIVCILLGADTPYVLRQALNGRYRMLGQW
jgi:hypothetical protein